MRQARKLVDVLDVGGPSLAGADADWRVTINALA
jgi:hypothetical protein